MAMGPVFVFVFASLLQASVAISDETVFDEDFEKDPSLAAALVEDVSNEGEDGNSVAFFQKQQTLLHVHRHESQVTVVAADGLNFSACAAEFIAMILFVVIGCGSAMGVAKDAGSAWILQVSLTFGLAITSLAYAIGHYSGGHINCAVTLGLVIAGKCTLLQGVGNFVAQMLGSVVGALFLTMIYPADKDKTGGLGSNSVGPDFSMVNALVGEVFMTFLLVYVVLETATNPATSDNRQLACVAIGFAVFLAHTVLIPIDGCSINPTRSFGPELVARMRYGKGGSDHIVFWVGPLAGAAIAAGVYLGMS